MKILIADDEVRMRKLVSDFLKREGYTVVEAGDGRAALEMYELDKSIDLAILDVMMPEYDGWAVCREIRKTSAMPIVMLTARSEENDELFGFGLGADEYITKPFSPMVLVARINALLKRTGVASKQLRNVAGLEIDENKHAIYTNGKKLDLSPKEYDLLIYFVNNEGAALSRGQILNAVWNYDFFGDTRTVDTHIKKLRNKLEDKGDLIETVRGFGYMFEAKKS